MKSTQQEFHGIILNPREGAFMRKPLSVFVLTSSLIFGANLNAQDKDLTLIVSDYLEARALIMQENATVEDVDKVMAFYTDGFVYEHPKAGAKISGTQAHRNGMIGFLGASKNVRFQILHVIAGFNQAAVEMRLTGLAKNGKQWEEMNRIQVLFFEFDKGKISRITENWR